jgi:hypothetical protein
MSGPVIIDEIYIENDSTRAARIEFVRVLVDMSVGATAVRVISTPTKSDRMRND